jgi:hypothetical protein
MPGTAEFERRKNRGRGDAVTIDFSASRETGMESGRDNFAPQDANLWRKGRVQGRRQDARLEPGWSEINMGALAKRMGAGISPARTMHSDLFSGDLDKCSLDPILNGVAARLTLPTAEALAVVGDDQF